MSQNSKGFYQGTYDVVNKNKYMSNKAPQYRSSWESRLCYYLDHNEKCIRWGHETVIIPYQFDLDRNNRNKKIHKYITDFYAEILCGDGKLVKYILEVKPAKQLLKPTPPKIKNMKAIRNYKYSLRQWIQNKNKWKAANAFCRNKGMVFKIMTENNIF